MPMLVRRKVYKEDNTVFFLDDLDPESLYLLRKYLREINREGHYDHANIVIDSMGGSPCAIYDFLVEYPLELHGYVDGYCCSGATTILLGCQKRFMASSSLLLIHSYQGPGEDYVKEGSLRDEHNNIVKQNDTLRRIYKKETRIPQKELDALMSDREKFLTAQECKKWKVIDEIKAFVGV